MSDRLAWLGLGGNVGDVRAAMIAALNHLDRADGIGISRVSGLYETPPWGRIDQPAFVNACAEIVTSLAPRELLRACLDAEQALHRVRKEKWGPRTIDIDILAIDGVEYAGEGLIVPHAHLAERAFALVPLSDLAPELVVGGQRVRELLARLDARSIRQLSPPSRWRQESPPWSDPL